MIFKTVTDLNRLIANKLYLIPKNVDLVVGVPRSGMLPATIISLYLNLPLADIDSLVENKIYKSGITKVRNDWVKSVDECESILIVEDSSSTGSSIKKIKQTLNETGLLSKVIFLTIYVTDETKHLTDIYFEICELPRMFEWNYMHHQAFLRNMCFDIDGVLCVDPKEDDNDDGERYINFIKNAEHLLRPSFTIGHIITSRLEKYRDLTKEWLDQNDIHFDQLIMMDYSSKEERIKYGNHAEFKAKHYKALKNAEVFVESDPSQAKEIARLSGKLVYCVGNCVVYDESKRTKMTNNIKFSFKRLLKKFLPDTVIRIIKRHMSCATAFRK